LSEDKLATIFTKVASLDGANKSLETVPLSPTTIIVVVVVAQGVHGGGEVGAGPASLALIHRRQQCRTSARQRE